VNDTQATGADRSALRRVSDLLTDEERQQLYADLAEMARLRMRAAAESANWPLP
jgi:hypothetical protein